MTRGRYSPSVTMILFLSVLVLLIAVVASMCMGVSGISLADMLAAVRGDTSSAAARIFLYVRLPRTLAAMIAGSALAVAGTLLQSVLRNPLAAPSVVGINSGAALMALICMAVLPSMMPLLPFAAFAGALVAAFGVYLLGRAVGASRTTIVLAGVAVNSMLGAIMDTIVTIVPDAALSRASFSIGSFSNVTMARLGFALPFWALGLLLALGFRRELNVLALGDDVAASLGVRVDRYRALFLVAAALLAGSAISFSGLIGFVGLIVPHMVGALCRHEEHLRIPVTAVCGAALCLICDLLARTLFMPYELPVSVVLSFLGAPFFLYLLIRQKKRNRHDTA